MIGFGGREDRRRVRQLESDKSRWHAEESIDMRLREAEAADGQWAPALSPRRHDTLIQDILELVVNAKWPQGKILAALRHLARRSRAIVDRYALQIAPFQAPVIDNRLDAYRSDTAFHQGVAARVWDEAFGHALLHHRANRRDGFEFWAGLTLFSAISRSGLLSPWQIGALCLRLHDAAPWLSVGIFDRPVMHFRQQAPGSFYNSGTAGIPFLEWHFVPDGLTLALLSRARRCAIGQSSELGDGSPEVAAYRLICTALFDRKQRDDFRALSQLCKATSWLVETRKGVAMPRALIDIMTSQQPSIALERQCHDHMWSQASTNAIAIEVADCSNPATGNVPPDWTDVQLRFLEMTRASLQLFTDDGRRVPAAKAADELFRQATHFFPGTIEHLLTVWLESRINRDARASASTGWKDMSGRRKRTIAVSSALRYHHWISMPLLDRLAGTDLTTLTIMDLEDLYDDILAEEPNLREQGTIAGRLADLHDFAAQHPLYRFPPLRDALVERARSVKRVRARTLAADTYHGVRAAVRAGVSDPLAADQLELILALAYRCGLRIGEIVKLRIEDIEPSDERTLFIRQNSYGSNKSHAARRKIVCGRILTYEERALFDRVVAVRRRQGNLNGTLFQKPGKAVPFDRLALSSAIGNALRDATASRGWTFHHLRHSAANNIILTVLDATELAKRLAGWDEKQQLSVKRAILRETGPHQHRLNSVAAFLGHAGPGQTLESYFHLAPELIGERTGQAVLHCDLRIYAEALNIPPSRIATCSTDADIVRHFQPRWKKLVERPMAPTSRAKPRTTAAIVPEIASRAPIEQCLLFIAEVERGTNVQDAAALVQLPLSTAARWFANARMVANQQTRWGNSRFFAKSRIDAFGNHPERRELLLPGVPNPPHHRSEAIAMLDVLWGLRSHRADELHGWLDFALNNFAASKSRIRIKDPIDAGRFLAFLAGTPFSGKRWQLEMIMDSAQAQAWLPICGPIGVKIAPVGNNQGAGQQVSNGRARWSRGHAHLLLRETQFDKRPLGDAARVEAAGYLGYAIHLAAIMLM